MQTLFAEPTSNTNSDTSLNLSKDMPQNIQKETGVDQMNPDQIKALTSWIEKWSQSQIPQTPPPAPNQVVSVLGDGHFVKLGDGSVWNINSNAWIYTYYWKAGDTVQISPGSDTLFPYSLTSSSSSQSVNAQKATKSVSDSFKTSYTISQIQDNGKILVLSDNSCWQINPSARYMSAGWSVGQSVFIVEQTQSALKGYELFNGDTTRSVLATKLPPLKTPSQKVSNDSKNTPAAN